IPLDKFIVGYTGKLGVSNAIEFLIDSADKLQNHQDIIFVIVGRFVEAKGFIYLIKAFAKIDRNIRDKMNLILVGDGVEKTILEEAVLELGIKNDVIFLGYQDNPYKYMKESDLFVLSSLWEGFGIVIIEAMVLNIPIVSSNCKYGPSEILLDENKIEYGKLVNIEDDKEKYSDSLSTAIIDLYIDPELRNKYNKLSMKRVSLFNIDNIIQNYINLFNKSENNE
ncbi:MAG: glycosyltransferase, partial [Campylobacterota bacterium]|nr:glycosyltransferase [Campylobacterota bacterium]